MKEEKSSNDCLACGATGDQVILLQCQDNGRLRWVYARCLPILIHGGHENPIASRK